ncbi:DUF58 domain-containing protein [Thermococcus waiotapuensis]|uniref:DUF58 domain-containing protein n=1 Tax=Thermococcus waiotapuensis TaxID=90909 RepID=A0AAE4T4B5_9EURY|nr:DUF58 domain-containing protein [Thermococcus waiotapuensis]MDV3104723.1 DUF58 domain-containing protein [Thermococcus waiotapuensis]
MKTADFLLGLSGVLLAGAIFLQSPALAGISSMVMAYYSAVRLAFRGEGKVVLKLPERATELEWAEIPVEVESKFGVPGKAIVRIRNPDLEAEDASIDLEPEERAKTHLRIKPLKKGTLDPSVEAFLTDKSGLFMRELMIEGVKPLTVLPSPKKVAEARRLRKEPNAFAELLHALGIGSESIDFEELREFMPGDDIKKIDWKATSRILKPVVKVFKRETLADVYVLVNVDESFRREIRNVKTDYLALILAQLIAYFARHGHRVGIVAYNDGEVYRVIRSVHEPKMALSELKLEPKPGRPQLRPSPLREDILIRRILRIKARTPLSGIEKAVNTVPESSYVVILDDIGLHPWAILSAASMLEEKGSKIAILYPNPVRFIPRESVRPENLESLYLAYKERKELLRKIRGRITVVEVSPKDLLPRVVNAL